MDIVSLLVLALGLLVIAAIVWYGGRELGVPETFVRLIILILFVICLIGALRGGVTLWR